MQAPHASTRMGIYVIACTSSFLTHAVGATPPARSSGGTAACAALARGYLWVSCALVLLAGVGAALCFWNTKQKNIVIEKLWQQLQRVRLVSNPKTLRCLLLWIECVLMGGWGVMGVALASTSKDCDSSEQENALVALSIVVASSCVLGCGVLLVKAVFVTIQTMAPGQEASPAIVCLRCSCCSQVLKRAVLFAPVALLASVNFVSWHDSQSFGVDESQCRSFVSTFFGGTAIIFLIMAVAQLLSFCVSSCSKALCQGRRSTPSSPPGALSSAALGIAPATPTPLVTRRRQRLVVLVGLLVLSLVCIAWASLGWIWMSRSNSSTAKCAQPQSVMRSMSVSIALLFIIGWTLLTLTFCCRLEDFVIVSSNETLIVDASVLPPRLVHSPRATCSTPANGQPRGASLATASGAIV